MEGKPAPDFTLTDQNGKLVTLSNLLGHNVILYFYPADNTRGCTIETKYFEQRLKDFENTIVLGVSNGTDESKTRMAETCGVSFSLLNDTDNIVKKMYGVKNVLGLLPGRTTFYIDINGIIQKIHSSSTNMKSHIEEGLKLFGKKF